MMQIAKMPNPEYQVNLNSGYRETHVIRRLDSQQFELSDTVKAVCAISCVIVPQEGDRVLSYTTDGSEKTYILAILQRQSTIQTAQLTVPGHNGLKIAQSSIQCHASQKIEMGCLENIKLTSVRGNIEMRAQSLVQTMVCSIIESAKERISNADFIQFCASFLTRIHSNQTIVTADSDIKIDAERVNLG